MDLKANSMQVFLVRLPKRVVKGGFILDRLSAKSEGSVEEKGEEHECRSVDPAWGRVLTLWCGSLAFNWTRATIAIGRSFCFKYGSIESDGLMRTLTSAWHSAPRSESIERSRNVAAAEIDDFVAKWI